MKKVAINGFGRIGRLVFRIMEENPTLEVVAINDLTDAAQLAYLLKYDSSHRNYRPDEISYDENHIIVKDRKIAVYQAKDPQELPWQELAVDIVLECSGVFTSAEKAQAHIDAGAKKVLISAPAKGDLKTVVYNVNHDVLDGSEKIVSAASCTTNCLAPTIAALDKKFGVVRGYMTTVHAYTNDQATLDVAHPKGADSRRGRAAAANIVPSSTGAASAIGLVMPHLKGKLDGFALRVPTITGSVIDLVLELKQNTTPEAINEVFQQSENETIKVTYDPIVSSDIIGSSYGAIVDAQLTDILEVDGKQLVKVVAWYDNEYGYSVQMIRLAKKMLD